MVEIKNLKKIANRILKAVEGKERIIIYGDSDPDGVGSVIILEEALKDLGLSPAAIYFPDREKEGYGVNKTALKYLEKKAPALFITLDCGIGNIEEVEIAKQMGFEVIIIDHHKMLPQIPKASIICDPKQKGDKYPFKELATAGIAYKLVKLLFSLTGEDYKPEKFLELAALSTLADMMILENDNEKIVREGVLALNFTQRPGLIALMDLTDFKNWDTQEVRRKLISPLNAGQTKRHLNEAYSLLVEKDLKKAKSKAKRLMKKAEKKGEEISRVTQEVEEGLNQNQEVIFEGKEDWSLVWLGPAASRLCQRFGKPVFLFKKGEKESPGAVRMPKGLDAVKAMISCKELLKTYGGHPLAAGFRIKNGNIKKFKKCLIKYFGEAKR